MISGTSGPIIFVKKEMTKKIIKIKPTSMVLFFMGKIIFSALGKMHANPHQRVAFHIQPLQKIQHISLF